MNRRALILTSVLVLAAAMIFLGYRARAAGKTEGVTQYKVAKVETGQVRKTVSSSGTLKPWNVVDIKARAGGELTLLAVDVGSEVVKGQILANIDPLDVQLSLNTARADEESARSRKSQSEKSWQLQIEQSKIAVRDAEANLRSAEASLAAARARLATAREQAKAQPELTRTAIANAEASYQQAVKQRNQLDATTPQQRAAAKASYEQAMANLENARLNIDRQKSLVQKGFVAQQAVDTAQASLEVAQATADSAKAKLDTVDAELAASIAAADERVKQSKAALDSARASQIDIPNRQNAVREAEAAVRQAEAQLLRSRVAVDQARANQANNEIRRFDVSQAEASIARAEASRINAQTTLERTVIRAPADGVVLTKYVEQGTIIQSSLGVAATGQSIVQIGDVSRMYVDVSVDETDIASIDVGQVVDVAIDAYPGVPFEGKVIRIDPQAVVEQNVTMIHVRVEVDNTTATYKLLKPGMNATCEFVIDEKEDVVYVPLEAVREDDNGKYVETATGGKPAPPDPKTGDAPEEGTLIDIQKKRVTVEVGLEGNERIEILSGLKEGDQIITQTIEPAAPTAGGSPFGGGGFGGGRGGFGGGGRGPGGGGGGGGRGR